MYPWLGGLEGFVVLKVSSSRHCPEACQPSCVTAQTLIVEIRTLPLDKEAWAIVLRSAAAMTVSLEDGAIAIVHVLHVVYLWAH